ncbi:hypothetical protein TCAL_00650 [Tigriopus californicus]|uniref:Uncharacterized protein n=1 Tax=Tigriopus californicus TaxID=6832 RepID=A0A553P9S1_TIGCA|nr:hypothetical protein TCAL_00650 [Tigriopus californicus]|eukprot:TCALIF_00650-PA protein Name:"Similar to mRpL19 39S ribosomal protein L19, mitochondrial (Drosophila melanogaster)" AED:0.91 eAED:0.91 QI:0/0/0/0.33/1/1/3/0/484
MSFAKPRLTPKLGRRNTDPSPRGVAPSVSLATKAAPPSSQLARNSSNHVPNGRSQGYTTPSSTPAVRATRPATTGPPPSKPPMVLNGLKSRRPPVATTVHVSTSSTQRTPPGVSSSDTHSSLTLLALNGEYLQSEWMLAVARDNACQIRHAWDKEVGSSMFYPQAHPYSTVALSLEQGGGALGPFEHAFVGHIHIQKTNKFSFVSLSPPLWTSFQPEPLPFQYVQIRTALSEALSEKIRQEIELDRWQYLTLFASTKAVENEIRARLVTVLPETAQKLHLAARALERAQTYLTIEGVSGTKPEDFTHLKVQIESRQAAFSEIARHLQDDNSREMAVLCQEVLANLHAVRSSQGDANAALLSSSFRDREMGFFLDSMAKRPHFSLKATTLDGCLIAFLLGYTAPPEDPPHVIQYEINQPSVFDDENHRSIRRRDFRFIFPEFLPDPNSEFRQPLAEKLARQDLLRRRAQVEIPLLYRTSALLTAV